MLKSSKASTDMFPLLRELEQIINNFQKYCDQDDMLTEKHCNDCVNRGKKKPGIRHVFQYISNEAKIRDMSIISQIIVIKTPPFGHRCDKS